MRQPTQRCLLSDFEAMEDGQQQGAAAAVEVAEQPPAWWASVWMNLQHELGQSNRRMEHLFQLQSPRIDTIGSRLEAEAKRSEDAPRGGGRGHLATIDLARRMDLQRSGQGMSEPDERIKNAGGGVGTRTPKC